MRTLLLIGVLAFAAPDRPDLTPKVAKPSPNDQISGDWIYAGAGKDPIPNTGTSIYVFRITPTETIWIERGQPSNGNGFTAKINLDWTKNPVAIDFMPRRGGNPIRGIVKLDGDRLTLAWSNNDTRPVDFGAPGNLHHFVRKK